jgi:hypothetical protein
LLNNNKLCSKKTTSHIASIKFNLYKKNNFWICLLLNKSQNYMDNNLKNFIDKSIIKIFTRQ